LARPRSDMPRSAISRRTSAANSAIACAHPAGCVDLWTALRVTTGQHFQATPGKGLTAGIRQTRTRDREAQAVVRYREDTPGGLARARAAVTARRDRNPAGTGEELLAAIGHQFHRDYGVVLRAALFAVDRHRARRVTGISAEERRP
jgi:hypothetical protein